MLPPLLYVATGIQMPFRSLVILILALLAMPANIPAEEGASLKAVVATLEEGYRTLEDVRANFTQKARIASLNRDDRGAGEMYLKRPAGAPAMFRFNYTKPQKQQIICNGKTVWLYTPDAKQVMTTDISGILEAGPGGTLNYLTGLGTVSRDFTISFVGSGRDKQGNYLLQLVPRNKSRILAKLVLTVSARAVEGFIKEGKAVSAFPLTASVVYDTAGNRTALEFANVRVNSGIAGTLFTFKPPAGVEVIKQ